MYSLPVASRSSKIAVRAPVSTVLSRPAGGTATVAAGAGSGSGASSAELAASAVSPALGGTPSSAAASTAAVLSISPPTTAASAIFLARPQRRYVGTSTPTTYERRIARRARGRAPGGYIGMPYVRIQNTFLLANVP